MADFGAVREQGAENRLTVAGQIDVGITNISYDIDTETETFQHNNEPLMPIHVITGARYSGSFEHNGSNEELRQAVRRRNGLPVHPQKVEIKLEEYEVTGRFKNVIIGSRSKDVPSDGATSQTYDFIAERWVSDESDEPPRDIYGGGV